MLARTPVGLLAIHSNGLAITRIAWAGPDAPETGFDRDTVCRRAAEQLDGYFSGSLTDFDVPVSSGGSALQQAVWRAIAAIPYGAVDTYGGIASKVGSDPQSVGQICGQNPVPIIVPCHRVVGAGGALTGYSGGHGLSTKRYLLDLESDQGRLF